MSEFNTEFLEKAIRIENNAREAYTKIADRIEVKSGKRLMLAMAGEERRHASVLTDRYRKLTGTEYGTSAENEGPAREEQHDIIDFSFIEKSVFSHTDAMEALKLCLGAELDAISFYEGERLKNTDRDDRRILKWLVRFEKKHKKKLEREIVQLEKHNHWKL